MSKAIQLNVTAPGDVRDRGSDGLSISGVGQCQNANGAVQYLSRDLS